MNAEINLPNLLATVFANTRRDGGEIPFAIGKDGHLYAPTENDRATLSALDVGDIDDVSRTRRVGKKMSSTGMLVGLLAGHGYSEREVQFAPGDRVSAVHHKPRTAALDCAEIGGSAYVREAR